MKLRDCAKFPKESVPEEVYCQCPEYYQGIEKSRREIGNLDLAELVDVDVEALAKEIFEICTYPSPEKWEESKDQDIWRTRAEIIIDKKAKWLKARG